MNHKTDIRTVPESDTAVLLLHGILGTPHQFDPLLSAIPENCTMVNLLLDGHGKGVEDFGRSSMKKWETQVAHWVEKLCATHENVLIIAHSMGTLFAIDAAIAHPDRVKGLLLLSPPLKIGLKAHALRYAFKVGFGLGREEDPEFVAVRHAYSMPPDRRAWKYLRWIPRYLELLAKIRATRKKLPQLHTPTDAFLCEKDGIVSVRTDRFLSELPAVRLFYLPHSTHFAYSADDAEQIRHIFSRLLDTATAKS